MAWHPERCSFCLRTEVDAACSSAALLPDCGTWREFESFLLMRRVDAFWRSKVIATKTTPTSVSACQQCLARLAGWCLPHGIRDPSCVFRSSSRVSPRWNSDNSKQLWMLSLGPTSFCVSSWQSEVKRMCHSNEVRCRQ